MQITIHMYGPLKEYFPAKMNVDLEDDSYVQHIINLLADLNPAAKSLLNSTRIAVGDEIINDNRRLNEHHEISLLPPSSGG